MQLVRVKICGITSSKDLQCAVEAGADAVGFIVDFPSSPRNITLAKAYELVRRVPVYVESVAVTVPENLNRLIKVYKALNYTTIQIHGSNINGAELRRKIKTKVVKAVTSKDRPEKISDIMHYDAVLLDSHMEGKYGGTGLVQDWTLCRKFKEKIQPKPLILAGGLTAENIGEAIRIVKPHAVDVSSGVESEPGVKDHQKIFQFIKKVRASCT